MKTTFRFCPPPPLNSRTIDLREAGEATIESYQRVRYNTHKRVTSQAKVGSKVKTATFRLIGYQDGTNNT